MSDSCIKAGATVRIADKVLEGMSSTDRKKFSGRVATVEDISRRPVGDRAVVAWLNKRTRRPSQYLQSWSLACLQAVEPD